MPPAKGSSDEATGPRSGHKRRRRPGAGVRQVLIRIGRAAIRARLLETPTAERIWRTLPIYSTAQTWGRVVLFEIHAETGREPAAKALVEPGEIAFQSEEDRIVIAYGATPISRKGEIRLPSPCNVWAVAADPVAQLEAVRPGDRVAVIAVE
ncbi:MAG: hypothetical protein F9K29_08725 [Hyphomicrobiaceae bacterium]|nr:MAG: hypothetical protein F9K29_08725 [Hyphomicrobiaceae bacterium]